jgi:GTP:adenosylcobinamide-phosphate guanylyltransferase
MIRSRLWFRCAAMHDPVTPVIVKPAVIGWDAKEREVELTIERAFKGDELAMRMKGWVTVDVKHVIEIIKKYGFLKVLDERDLVVDVETQEDYEKLNKELEENFKDQLNLERVHNVQ